MRSGANAQRAAAAARQAKQVTLPDVLDGHVGLDLACLDRIYLNGYVPNLQVAGQVVQFLTGHLGNPIPSPALMEQIGNRFRRGVARFADTVGVPVVRFSKDDRKADVMRPYLQAAATTNTSGVVALGWRRSSSGVFTAYDRRKDGSASAPMFSFAKADRRVSVFHFYLWDAEFGPAFIKVCSYFPYPVKIWVNGHEWAKQQARHVGLGFTELSNGFASCQDPKRLQRICDRLSPARIQRFVDRWLAKARDCNDRLLHAQRVGQGCVLASPALERVALSSVTAEGRRAPALRFGDPRVMALVGALSLAIHAVTGFTNRSVRAQVTGLLGNDDYTANQMGYDLARLRLNGLIQRLPGSNTFLRVRAIPAVVASIVAVDVLTALVGDKRMVAAYGSGAGIPYATFLPLLAACLVGATARSSMWQFEAGASRDLRAIRLATLLGTIAFSAAGILAATHTVSGPVGGHAAVHNLLGLTGPPYLLGHGSCVPTATLPQRSFPASSSSAGRPR